MKNNNILLRMRCAFLVLTAVFTMLSGFFVYAEDVTEVDFGEATAKAGDEVVIPVTIKNNPGIATFRFRVTYDTADIEFISAEKGIVLSNGTLSSKMNTEEGNITFLWFSPTNVYGDGEIVHLKFKISADAQPGDRPLSITYLPEDMLNENVERVSYTVDDGMIFVGSVISGVVTSFGDEQLPVTLRLLNNGTEIDEYVSTKGEYSFRSLSPGTYIIEVSKLNHATRTYEITIGNEDAVENFKIHLKGDVNGDGRVNVVDVAKANAHAKKTVNLEGYELICADINTDGRVNVVDVAKMNAHAKKSVFLW